MLARPDKVPIGSAALDLIVTALAWALRFGVVGLGLGVVSMCLVPGGFASSLLEYLFIRCVLGGLVGVTVGAAGGAIDTCVRRWRSAGAWVAGAVVVSACGALVWVLLRMFRSA